MTVLRVNPTRARAYAFAAGSLAKTDAVDARVLAQLPATVANGPEPAFDAEREALASLHRRRDQMVETRAVERGRSRDVSDAAERGSLQRHITWLDGEIKALDGELQGMIAKPAFAKTAGLLRSVRGVGAVTAATVLALLPELGQRSAKSIAALVGLAPINRDSGMYRGQMHIGGGRKRVRQALYMAALSAIRAVPRLKLHYEAIKARSGHAKVAIIAIARKLLVILNAKARDARNEFAIAT